MLGRGVLKARSGRPTWAPQDSWSDMSQLGSSFSFVVFFRLFTLTLRLRYDDNDDVHHYLQTVDFGLPSTKQSDEAYSCRLQIILNLP